MLKIKFLLLGFILLLFSEYTFSQTFRKLTNRTDKYIAEIKEFFNDIDNSREKKIGKEFLEQFAVIYDSGVLSEDQKKLMIQTSNDMLAKKMRQFPHFYKYLSTIAAFAQTEFDEDKFIAWHKSFDPLIKKGNSAKFISYLDVSLTLFSDNILYQSNAAVWKSSSDNYDFEYDGKKPKIIFHSLDLICYSRKDSTVIYNTKGVYYPSDYEWIGQGGKVNWLRAGFPEDKVYAILSNYDLKVRFSKFIADSVNFFYKDLFNAPLLGTINEKVLANSNPENSSYPRFTSYDHRLKISEIFENIDYEGGFSLFGARIVGTGSNDQDAILTFKMKNKKFVQTGSKSFVIRKDRIDSQNSSVTVFWDADSIYHPGLEMTYINKDKTLSLYRNQEGLALSPFFNSYHQIDMYVEEIKWKMDEPKIDLRMVQGIGSVSEATFESNNYYSQYRFDRIQGLDRTHPLIVVKNYSDTYNTKEIYLEEMVRQMGLSEASVKTMLLNLANMGFLIYDLDENKIIIKDRLYNYINARNKKTDYDVISFYSVVVGKSSNNATLNLLNFDLRLDGVERVFLSDSQKVFIYPQGRELILKKNRDFVFDGKIEAGRFDFYGKECYFDYDRFKIELPIIDSLSFEVEKFDANPDLDYVPLVRVKTVIEDMSGNLLLDHPNNKSGLKPYDEYPIFNSKKNSFVFYDKPIIQKGVYSKDRFYYRLEPFTIDSLDNFKTDGLEFKGYLSSAGIFPDIDQPLKVMPDYSLGFDHITPPSGYQAYGGKGNYTAKISLSNKGLIGNGSLKYLTSTSQSNNFVFCPDSLTAELQYYEIEEQETGVEYPSVVAEDVYEKWLPYEDLMIVSKIEKPLNMFNSQANMNGKIDLRPSGLTGKGMMEISDAEIDSRLFRYKKDIIDADTSNFKLKAQYSDFNLGGGESSGYELVTYNYKAHIDFNERKGDFESNGGGSMVEFTLNQYICFIDQFEWYMDKDEIELSYKGDEKLQDTENMTMEEIADLELSGSEFISIHPNQDSLRFFARKAKYSRKSNTIHAYNVEYIKVADATIFPEKGNVDILKDANMMPLENSRIMANNATKYHKIFSAFVKINGRKNYDGRGVYNYKDEIGNIQNIYLNKITVDTTAQTYGLGEIAEAADFSLSPDFDFIGNVKLIASKEFLNFDGGCRIKHNCDTVPLSWMKFMADINPIDVRIPVSENPKDMMNNDLFAGLLFTSDSNGVFPAFLSRAVRKADSTIISASGFLIYDKNNDEYRISNSDKLAQISLPGNYLSLSRKNCETYGEGKLNLGDDFGQLKVETYGNVKHFSKNKFTKFDLVLTMDFLFSEDALKLMNESLEKYYEMEAVSLGGETYSKALGEIVGDEQAQKYVSEIALNNGFKKIPNELKRTFFFSDVQMKWNPKTKSYISEGKIGIGSINKTQINKYVEGMIEIEREKSGNNMTVYLEFASDDWYIFEYTKNGVMTVYSNQTEFNTIIRDLKPDDKRMKVQGGEKSYYYKLGTIINKKRFLKKFEK
ncbi:MAG: hypothetical protein K9J13_02730 [Saprospiraceae bacterium]|nr:hypothetical protein [Saprospiraceae bacterium]